MNDDEIRVEAYNVTGKVNTTSTGARVTHIASGAFADCDTHRSFHANRASAVAALSIKLGAPELPTDRYETMTRDQLDAEAARRIDGLADAYAHVRSGNLHDDEVRRALRLLDAARKGEW